jgi:Tfp pilus assembly protein PilX
MRRREYGFTLVIGLIFLVLLALLAIAAFQLQRTNLMVTANSQYRNEALSYAEDAVDMALSGTAFFKTPESALPPNDYSACNGTNLYCGDVNGDGTPDYTVSLTPVPYCKSAMPISSASLDLSNPDDLGCAASVAQQFGVTGASSGNSLCANSLWEITAVSSDAATGASVTLWTGAGVRVSVDDIASSCP